MDSTFHYTDERNVQIVIALLKAHGVHRVIASPGTTNMTFVVSIENDPWFQIWSSVDERSAAYLACGMAAETGSSLSLIALETSVEIGTPRSPRRISFASTELVKKSITFAASSLFSEVVVTLKNCDGFIKIGCCTASSSVGYITME